MKREGSIRLARMFCPANDRNVPILFRDRPPEVDSFAGFSAGEPVCCLDYEFRCTGWLCPHFAAPELPERELLELALEAEEGRHLRGADERRAVLERSLRESDPAGTHPPSP